MSSSIFAAAELEPESESSTVTQLVKVYEHLRSQLDEKRCSAIGHWRHLRPFLGDHPDYPSLRPSFPDIPEPPRSHAELASTLDALVSALETEEGIHQEMVMRLAFPLHLKVLEGEASAGFDKFASTVQDIISSLLDAGLGPMRCGVVVRLGRVDKAAHNVFGPAFHFLLGAAGLGLGTDSLRRQLYEDAVTTDDVVACVRAVFAAKRVIPDPTSVAALHNWNFDWMELFQNRVSQLLWMRLPEQEMHVQDAPTRPEWLARTFAKVMAVKYPKQPTYPQQLARLFV